MVTEHVPYRGLQPGSAHTAAVTLLDTTTGELAGVGRTRFEADPSGAGRVPVRVPVVASARGHPLQMIRTIRPAPTSLRQRTTQHQ